MGYDQNNEYYNSGDQSWRDQTNVYQTQREQPTPMGRRSPRRKSGWLKGILAVLLVVAISFGAFYLMRNVGVRLERTEDGVTLSMTNRSKQAEPEQAEQPIPVSVRVGTDGDGRAATDNAQPTQGAYVGSGTKLNIVSSQESSDTTFSDEEDALSLQDIYSTVLDQCRFHFVHDLERHVQRHGHYHVARRLCDHEPPCHHRRARHLGSHERQSGV